MKLVYAVSRDSYNSKDHLGVKKKVEGQIHLFENRGIDVTLLQYEWKNGYPGIVIKKDTDILYFRRIEPSVKFIVFLSKMKKINPKLKIIMEIPTYPFDQEELVKKSLKRQISIKFGETFMRKYIDRIVLIGMEKEIPKLNGIKTICATNGVDFSIIKAKKTLNLFNQELHVICVSGCYFWHGYERFIEGMANYYQQEKCERDIYFHIVGEGQCLEQYVNLAKKYNMYGKKILIYGNKHGEELDAIYDRCDLALDSLGAHRKGIYFSSSLKTREYVAKGLPIITSTKLDLVNEETKKYILIVPADETPIDMNSIIKFYDSIYERKEKQQLPKIIREHFCKLVDWQYAFQEVINYMEED